MGGWLAHIGTRLPVRLAAARARACVRPRVSWEQQRGRRSAWHTALQGSHGVGRTSPSVRDQATSAAQLPPQPAARHCWADPLEPVNSTVATRPVAGSASHCTALLWGGRSVAHPGPWACLHPASSHGTTSVTAASTTIWRHFPTDPTPATGQTAPTKPHLKQAASNPQHTQHVQSQPPARGCRTTAATSSAKHNHTGTKHPSISWHAQHTDTHAHKRSVHRSISFYTRLDQAGGLPPLTRHAHAPWPRPSPSPLAPSPQPRRYAARKGSG